MILQFPISPTPKLYIKLKKLYSKPALRWKTHVENSKNFLASTPSTEKPNPKFFKSRSHQKTINKNFWQYEVETQQPITPLIHPDRQQGKKALKILAISLNFPESAWDSKKIPKKHGS
jgi:hypothetical protein